MLGALVNLRKWLDCGYVGSLLGGTYGIPELEGKIQITSEAFAVLEPFFTLRLDLGTSFRRSRVGLEGKIVQISTNSNTQTAVIIVNKRKPIWILVSSKYPLSGLYVLQSQLRPIVTVSVSFAAE